MSLHSLSVLHLAQSDSEGGASKAAYRLHRALCAVGVSSVFHAGRKFTDDATVVVARRTGLTSRATDAAAYINAATLKLYPGRSNSGLFSPARISYGHIDAAAVRAADVVCLHWIAGAFLRPSQLAAISKPIVWRLSDIWPFTGGCHYPGGCTRFEADCGSCPILGSRSDGDLSRRDYKARARAYRQLDLTIAAPSTWIADLARRSSLFCDRRIECIPTGVDLSVFRPLDQLATRQELGLSAGARIILFGALRSTEDRRKGYLQLEEAIARFRAMGERSNVHLVIFGGESNDGGAGHAGFPALHLGKVNNERALAKIYSAADVLVAPFLEDNLPNVVLEALACGTPVAAFAAGGIPDAVKHQVNGYLARTGDVEDLARGIEWVLDAGSRQAELRSAARRHAEQRFDLRRCSETYRALFAEISDRARPHEGAARHL